MVESIDGVFQAPVAVALLQQALELRALGLDGLEERLGLGAAVRGTWVGGSFPRSQQAQQAVELQLVGQPGREGAAAILVGMDRSRPG